MEAQTNKKAIFSTETLIPLGLVVSLIFGVVSVLQVYTTFSTNIATMAEKISGNQLAIAEIKSQCGNNPTREEFNQLLDSIEKMNDNINILIAK